MAPKPTQTKRPPPPPQIPKIPFNWPANITYLNSPSYSKYVTPAQLAAIRTPPPPPKPSPASKEEPLMPPVVGEGDRIPLSFPIETNPSVQIHPITDQKHPACGQSGLYAARDFAPGELILPYYGVLHVGTAALASSENSSGGAPPTPSSSSPADQTLADEMDKKLNLSLNPQTEAPETDEDKAKEAERLQHETSDYDLWLSREANVAVDGALRGNEARFVNDYRGVPGYEEKGANAEFRVVWDERIREWTMAVYVLPLGKKTMLRLAQAQREKMERMKKKAVKEGKTGGRNKEVVPKVSPVGVVRKGEEILVSYGRAFWERRREGV